MLTPSDVYSQFLLIATPDPDEGTDKILSLCTSGLERVMRKLRTDTENDELRIAAAAAGVVYYDYALSKLTDASDPRSFKAGDISVNQDIKDDILVAQKLRDSRLQDISDLFEDTCFGAWNV